VAPEGATRPFFYRRGPTIRVPGIFVIAGSSHVTVSVRESLVKFFIRSFSTVLPGELFLMKLPSSWR
jgi:hypothetical protein